MDGENRNTIQTPGMEVQKKRKWKKRGKQIRKSEEVENGSSDSNVIEADVVDSGNIEENLVFITKTTSLCDSPIIRNSYEDTEYYDQTTTDARGVSSTIENNSTQRQTSANNVDYIDQENTKRKNLIADNNRHIFSDGMPRGCLKSSSSVSNATEKAVTEISSEEVEQLYPSTSAAPEPEAVQLYNSKALPKEAPTYELQRFAKNVLIIFNQKIFFNDSTRKGTEKDVQALTNTFQAFDFDVFPYTDRTLTEINQILEAVSNQDFTDYGCVAIAVLTHGNADGEISAKDESYSEMDIINCLKTHKNHSLITKPRLLIIQACRGPNALAGVPVLRRGKTRTDLMYDTKPYTLPVEADMLVVHSSYAGNRAHRDELAGTWFIQTLCKKINEMAPTHDLESILTHVKHEVAVDKEHEVYNRVTDEIDVNKQIPVVTSTLIRKLYLRKYGEEEEYGASVVDGMCDNIAVDTAKVGSNTELCPCSLNYFDYMKNCLRHYVEENSTDSIAQSLLVLAETFKNEEIFNSTKAKCAVAIANHLEQQAKHSEYYKYLHIYKRF